MGSQSNGAIANVHSYLYNNHPRCLWHSVPESNKGSQLDEMHAVRADVHRVPRGDAVRARAHVATGFSTVSYTYVNV